MDRALDPVWSRVRIPPVAIRRRELVPPVAIRRRELSVLPGCLWWWGPAVAPEDLVGFTASV